MKKNKRMLTNGMVVAALVMQGTVSHAQMGGSFNTSSNESIRSFQVHIPEKQLIVE